MFLSKVSSKRTPVLFVHIPKTAGTSFRKSLQHEKNIIFDYGSGNPVTSKPIEKHIYEDKDFFSLKCYLQKKKFDFSGHFFLSKYSSFVFCHQLVSFVRNPLEQTVSHFNHMVKVNGYSESFEYFIESKQYINLQSKYLNGAPISLLGFVGVTECYDTSIDIFNNFFERRIPVKHDNKNTTPIVKKDTLLNEISERVLNLNHLDLMLFNQAEKLIHEKMLFLKKYSPRQWVYNYATINSNQVLSGAAFTSTQEPVELILKENGQEVSRFVANDFFNSFPNLVFPRGRYVGFRVPLKSKDENSFFSLEVTLTRQVIFYGKIES